MNITVIGATGKVGTLVARALLAEGPRGGPRTATQARPAAGSAPIPGRRSSRATWARRRPGGRVPGRRRRLRLNLSASGQTTPPGRCGSRQKGAEYE